MGIRETGQDEPAPAQASVPTYAARPIDESSLIDLHKIARTVRRRSKLIAVISVTVCVATFLAYAVAVPTYTAKAQIVLDRKEDQVIDVAQVAATVTPDSPAVDTEVEVLKSPQLAGRVVDALHLERNPEFNPELRPDVMSVKLMKWISGFGAPQTDNTLDARQQREAAIRSVMKGLATKRTGVSYAIDISFTSESPRTAAAVANAFADQYLLSQLDTKFEATQRANTWLNTRLSGLRGQLEVAENAVQSYKAAHGLLDVATGSSITQQEISGLNGELARAQAEQAAADARLRTAQAQLAKGSTGEELGEALNSSVVSQLRSKRAEISRQLADLSGRYGPKHPDLLIAQRQLADIDAQIQGEVRRIIANLDTQAQVARQRTGSIQGSLGRSRGSLTADNAASVRLNELERNAESVRVLYQAFLDRFKQTTAQTGLEQSNAHVNAYARMPSKPSAPNPMIFVILGIGAALGLSALAVVVLQFLETGVSTSEEVERRLNMPVLASIPDIASLPEAKSLPRRSWPVAFLVEKPTSVFAEAFRNLRTSIMFSNTGKPVQVVAVTSSLPGEGKTTTSLCLARAASLAGARVVVVDCDLRRRSLNRELTSEPKVGLLDVLSGRAPLASALIEDEVSGAFFLPQKPGPYVAHDVLGSPEMERLIQELRANFDFIVLDTAPVLPVAETRILATRVDAVVFLVRWRKTPVKAAELGLKYLKSVGAHVGGVVLSQVNLREQTRSGYGDVGYYYNSYKSYYS